MLTHREVDIDKVWTQAYYLAYINVNFSPELSIQNIIENEERNKSYREARMEEELLCKYYEISENPEDFQFNQKQVFPGWTFRIKYFSDHRLPVYVSSHTVYRG